MVFNSSICSIEGCGRLVHAGGMCASHYARLQRHGDPCAGRPPNGARHAWIDAHLDYDGADCLAWPFAQTGAGYGCIAVGKGESVPAHRFMCERVNGPPPTPKHEAAHSCGKGHEGCVNPRHLRWATRKENHADKNVHGTHQRGQRGPNAKLDFPAVLRVQRLLSIGKSKTAIAELFGVHRSTIRFIATGRTWRLSKIAHKAMMRLERIGRWIPLLQSKNEERDGALLEARCRLWPSNKTEGKVQWLIARYALAKI